MDCNGIHPRCEFGCYVVSILGRRGRREMRRNEEKMMVRGGRWRGGNMGWILDMDMRYRVRKMVEWDGRRGEGWGQRMRRGVET